MADNTEVFRIKWCVDGERDATPRFIDVDLSDFNGMTIDEAEDYIQELVDDEFARRINPYVDAYDLAYQLVDLGVVLDD